jgi:hypothetical protein
MQEVEIHMLCIEKLYEESTQILCVIYTFIHRITE